MSGYPIDTNILSEYDRAGGPDADVKRWLGTTNRQWLRRALAGRPLPVADSLIAATALDCDLTIAIRNTRGFEGIGATAINPWEAA